MLTRPRPPVHFLTPEGSALWTMMGLRCRVCAACAATQLEHLENMETPAGRQRGQYRASSTSPRLVTTRLLTIGALWCWAPVWASMWCYSSSY